MARYEHLPLYKTAKEETLKIETIRKINRTEAKEVIDL